MYRHPSRALINLDAYALNLELVRRLVGNSVAIVPVIKADAYGHGIEPIARTAAGFGAGLLAVATIEEGIKLRECGIDAPILVMIHPSRDALPLFIQYNLTLMVCDTAMADAVSALAREAGQVVRVHCKVDTGMGRQGVAVEEALETIRYISRIMNIDLQGICTHFPCADIAEDAFTYGQIKSFKQLVKQLDKLGIPYEMTHAANSAAIVNYRESIFDAVRPGLITYGIWPTEAGANKSLLKPVLRWETSIVQVRNLKPGTTIGYGRSHTTHKPTRTAVLPVGYADGFRHQLSNNADVLVRGKRCPVLGAVSMDQIVVDITQAPGAICGDTATLIGEDHEQVITVEELAGKAGTIPYDILTGIGPRVARVYIGGPTPQS